jgi:hypothetical protein
MEICANCGQAIGNLETPHIFNGRVVCAECYGKLSRRVDYAAKEFEPLRTRDTTTKQQRKGAMIACAAIPIFMVGAWMLSAAQETHRYDWMQIPGTIFLVIGAVAGFTGITMFVLSRMNQ